MNGRRSIFRGRSAIAHPSHVWMGSKKALSESQTDLAVLEVASMIKQLH
jgi:hypothetical protein